MFLAKFAAAAALALALTGDPFSFEYPGSTDGAGKVYLNIKANENMTGVEILIKGDGQTITRSPGAMKKGQAIRITWTQRSGQSKYELEVKGKGVEASFAFEVLRKKARGKVGKLKVRSSREDITQRHNATYETSFTLTQYQYKVYDADGDVVAHDTITGKVEAGGQFTIKWDSDADVFMIWVRGDDEFGRFTEYKLVPWAVEIPHTEINFDTDKNDVKNDEAPKLDEAVAVAFHELDALERVNKAVNAQITPRLYIVGFTDTVGKASYNQKLSQRRARAIAEYFRDKGFWAEIYYSGMGERGLRVETGDNVDEVRNRRALYLIGVDQPRPGGQIPSRWSKLVGHRGKPPGFELPALPERWANYREQKRLKALGKDHDPDMSDSLPGGEDGGGGGGDGGGGDPIYPDSDDGGPPPIDDGGPGATKKGCSVASPTPPVGSLVLLALLGLRRRSACPKIR